MAEVLYYEIRDIIRRRGGLIPAIPNRLAQQFDEMSSAVVYEIRNLLRDGGASGSLSEQISWQDGLGPIAHVQGPADEDLIVRAGPGQSVHIESDNGLSTGARFTVDATGFISCGRVGDSGDLRIYSSNSTGTGAFATIICMNSGLVRFSAGNGSGATVNQLEASTHFRPQNDDSADFGETGQRWRSGRFGTGNSSFDGSLGVGIQMPNSRLDIDAGALECAEIADPAAPATNRARIYARDTGGKTELVVRFPTGAIQQIAIEP